MALQTPPRANRRDEYAALTRQAMRDAARGLFAEQGYSATTVNQIAERARVSPATVYAQAGGKHGLLESLMLAWSVDESVQGAPERWAAIPTAEAKLAQLIRGTMDVYRDFGDLIEIGRRAAAVEPIAAEFMVTTTARFRDLLGAFVGQLRQIHALREGIDDREAVDAIHFHLRFEQVRLLSDDFGWAPERIGTWLHERIADAILAVPR